MKREFYQCVQNDNKNVTPIETIKAIKEAGFDGVFVQWYDKKWECNQQEQVDLCKSLGLKIYFAHLGYENINDIWVEGDSGDELVSKYLRDLDECHANGIDLVCLHLTSKEIAPSPSEIGIKRIQIIINYANKLNMKVAFENTKIFGYLEYVFSKVKNDNIGICYDSGHAHCHFDDKFNWKLFKNRIFAVHLHDNDKSKDQHLLPFEGTIDWNKLVDDLNGASYDGPVILESCYRNQYLKYSLLEFYKTSLEKAKKIYDLNN